MATVSTAYNAQIMSHQSQSNNFKAALIADGFAGDLVIPGDPQYAASLTRNAKRNAALVAFVKSAEDVSKVIKYVNARLQLLEPRSTPSSVVANIAPLAPRPPKAGL